MTSSPSPSEALTLLYRHASLNTHPDRGGSTELMLRVNAAAEVLRRGVEPVHCMRLHCVGHVPFDNHVFASGRWRGMRMSEIPLSALAWHADVNNDSSLYDLAVEWLHYRVSAMQP